MWKAYGDGMPNVDASMYHRKNRVNYGMVYHKLWLIYVTNCMVVSRDWGEVIKAIGEEYTFREPKAYLETVIKKFTLSAPVWEAMLEYDQ